MNYVRNKKLQSVNGDKCDDFLQRVYYAIMLYVFVLVLPRDTIVSDCGAIILPNAFSTISGQQQAILLCDTFRAYFFCFLDQYTEHSFFVMEMPVESIVHFNKGGSIAQENIV